MEHHRPRAPGSSAPRRGGTLASALRAATFVALAPLALAACSKGSAKEDGINLQSAVAQRRDIISSVEATGTIEPVDSVDVKSQASGEILEMPVELGDHVKQGQLLVRIDPRDVQNAYDQAKADLEVAKSQARIADQRLDRTQTLYDSSVVTKDDLETAVLNQAQAQASLVKAQTNLELARKRLGDATVRAPIDGTIIDQSVQKGQIVSSTNNVNGGTSLLKMANLRKMQVRTLVDETDIGRVKPGLAADITVDAFPDRTFHGQVLKIEPQAVVQQNVTMFAVLTQIPNENELLQPGMNADVDIVVGRRDSVLALPNGGVKTPDEARQLVDALGLSPELLQASAPVPNGDTAVSGAAGAPDSSTASGDSLPTMARLRSMSPDERRKFFQSLSPAQRQELFQKMRARREAQQQAQRSNPSMPKPAFVFQRDEKGGLTLRPITIGLSSLDYTAVLAGLQPGDSVLQVPLSLIQQKELLQRIRRRSGVPGVSKGG